MYSKSRMTSLRKPVCLLQINSPKISPSVALFLLSQVFLILHHKPLVRQLVSLLLGVSREGSNTSLPDSELHPRIARFVKPDISLSDDFIHIERNIDGSTFYSTQSTSLTGMSAGKTTPTFYTFIPSHSYYSQLQVFFISRFFWSQSWTFNISN